MNLIFEILKGRNILVEFYHWTKITFQTINIFEFMIPQLKTIKRTKAKIIK